MILHLIKSKIQSGQGYKNLLTAKFDVNYIENTAIMHTTGINAENKEVSKSTPGKLEDAEDFTNIVTGQLQKILQYDKMNVVYFTMDFKEKKCSAEVYYIKAGKKLKAIENIKL
jgi:hypothetical protein